MAGPAPLRLPRASVFAAVCTGVSSAGHVLASGHAVPLLGIAVGFTLMLTVGYGLSRSERSLALLIGTTLWGQAVLHLLFAVASSGGPASHTAEPGALPVSGAGPAMLLAHAIAGAVCAWWLRQGERAAFALADLARSLLHRLLLLIAEPSSPLPPVCTRDLARTASRRPAPLLFLRHTRVTRGPPAAFLD